MAPTYLATLSAFTHFLTAYTHTLLYLRTLYPHTSFTRSRFHNTPVYQSRHPFVCEWIRDAITAVRDELLDGAVSKIGIVIYSYGSEGGAKAAGNVKIMERYMLDVSKFPVIPKADRNMEIEWDTADVVAENSKGKQKALDADVDVNLSEQFRAALLTLTTRCAQLAPLPQHCSFNISMELKDEVDVDPPVGHPKPWIPVQPSLQKTGRKGADIDIGSPTEGQDLGGAKVTPIRAVEAGVFKFETWIEEGQAKFELAQQAQDSFASSG